MNKSQVISCIAPLHGFVIATCDITMVFAYSTLRPNVFDHGVSKTNHMFNTLR